MLTKQNQQVTIEKKEIDPVLKWVQFSVLCNCIYFVVSLIRRLLPPSIPLVKDISRIVEKGEYLVKRGWFMSHDSNILEHKLPHWMGQITLKGVDTERVS